MLLDHNQIQATTTPIMSQSSIPLITAEEVSLDDYPSEGINKPQRMYLLVLAYGMNAFQHQFSMLYGTDFTKPEYLQHPRIYFNHCELRNGGDLTKDMVVTLDCPKRILDKFTAEHDLPVANLNPNESVYAKKILVEASGLMKRYRNTIDFQRGMIKSLSKTDILTRVRVLKDQYLINFLKRLQDNCPVSWKRDLDNIYGLGELVDDVGAVTSQFDDDYGTQQIDTQAGYHTRTNFRLLNEQPIRRDDDISKYPDVVQQLSKEIIKKEESVIFSDSNEVSPTSNRSTSVSVGNVPAHNNSLTINHSVGSSNALDGVIPETQNLNYDEEIKLVSSPVSPEPDSNNYKEVAVCGFSPNGFETLLVKNIYTAKYEILDTFELYLKLEADDKIIYTLTFKNSEDIYRLVFPNAQNSSQLTSDDEDYVRETVANRFAPNSVIKLPFDIYLQYRRGAHEAVAPSFAESAPGYILYK